VPHTIEEAYEVADAIDRNDMEDFKSELGDLLFQIVFYSQIAKEQNLFDFHDIARGIRQKMHDRHPHVFSDVQINSEEEQKQLWEEIKKSEKARKSSKHTSILADTPENLPALSRASKLHKKATAVGFDWPDITGVVAKLDEELDEIKHEIDHGQNSERMKDEIGDLLFVTTILARHAGVDPEDALRHANNKFIRRFEGVEQKLLQENIDIQDAGLEKMDALWDEVKLNEK
jgi:MazG family protein